MLLKNVIEALTIYLLLFTSHIIAQEDVEVFSTVVNPDICREDHSIKLKIIVTNNSDKAIEINRNNLSPMITIRAMIDTVEMKYRNEVISLIGDRMGKSTQNDSVPIIPKGFYSTIIEYNIDGEFYEKDGLYKIFASMTVSRQNSKNITISNNYIINIKSCH